MPRSTRMCESGEWDGSHIPLRFLLRSCPRANVLSARALMRAPSRTPRVRSGCSSPTPRSTFARDDYEKHHNLLKIAE